MSDFDRHIELSIPNYRHIWDIISSLASYFIVQNSNVYDIGCSTGAGINHLCLQNKQANVSFTGYDISDNLLKPENQRTLGLIKSDVTKDSTTFYKASLILSIFTIQFIPTSDKERLLKKVYDSLINGGAFIITEKILNNTGRVQDIFTFAYYDFKAKNFSKEDILGKQYDLRPMMKNNTEPEILQMLRESGFVQIEPFFQSLQFKGWLCIK